MTARETEREVASGNKNESKRGKIDRDGSEEIETELWEEKREIEEWSEGRVGRCAQDLEGCENDHLPILRKRQKKGVGERDWERDCESIGENERETKKEQNGVEKKERRREARRWSRREGKRERARKKDRNREMEREMGRM